MESSTLENQTDTKVTIQAGLNSVSKHCFKFFEKTINILFFSLNKFFKQKNYKMKRYSMVKKTVTLLIF